MFPKIRSPKLLKKWQSYCSYCPKMCHFSCPVSIGSGKETLAPGWIMSIWRDLERGILPWKEGWKILYGCSGCRQCYSYCLHGHSLPDALEVARQEAWQHAKREILKEIQIPAENTLENLVREMESLSLPKDVKWVVLEECSHEKDEGNSSNSKWKKLFKKYFGESYYLLQGTYCCGCLWKALGDKEGYQKLFQAWKSLDSSHVEWIAYSAEQAFWLEKIFPRRVRRWWEKKKKKGVIFNIPPLDKEYFWYTSPYEKQREEKKLQKWAHQWKFPSWKSHFQESQCVGKGFGFSLFYPEMAQKMAQNFLLSLQRKGFQKVFLTCPRIGTWLKKQKILPVEGIEDRINFQNL